MTREEAYYILRVSRDEIQSKGHTEFDMLDLPCLDMAITALREQEERSKGCDWCEFFFDYSGKFRFCPQCGRRLSGGEEDGSD